jgi:hypothetical protein
MSTIPTALRSLVIERAGGRCEYCQLAQAGQAATFHIDHVVPLAAGGPTTAENLALACVSCSLRKAARVSIPDPDTGEHVSMFHPRTQHWSEHFRWDDVHMVGLTSTGRALVAALEMNRPIMLAIRAEEMVLGRHPPPEQR